MLSYFNRDFLNGHNLKNAVLGKVYIMMFRFLLLKGIQRKVAQIKV